MDSKEKYEYWLDIAEYDLSTARANYKSNRYLYVVFMCQQSIEKLIKGLYVLYTNGEADRTHNIARLINKLFEDNDFRVIQEYDVLSSEKDKYLDLFAELLYYYISERYPNYKEKLSSSITKSKAKEVLEKTEEAFVWLKSLSQYKTS